MSYTFSPIFRSSDLDSDTIFNKIDGSKAKSDVKHIISRVSSQILSLKALGLTNFSINLCAKPADPEFDFIVALSNLDSSTEQLMCEIFASRLMIHTFKTYGEVTNWNFYTLTSN